MAVSAGSVTGEQVKWATGCQDPVSAAERGRGGAAAGSGGYRDSLAARILLQLLRATALSSAGGGWRGGLYTGFVGVLNTVSAALCVLILFTYGLSLLAADHTAVYAASVTSFFGLQFALMWLSLVICFVAGRRPFGELLLAIGYLMEGTTLHGFTDYTGKLRKRCNGLLGAVICLMGMTCFMAFYSMSWKQSCATVSGCLLVLGYVLLLWLFYFSAYLIPFKFVFAALKISTGFSAISLELRAVVDGARQPDRLLLCQLRSLQDELSGAFARLTGIMSPELITLMFSGTLQLVSISMMVIAAMDTGDFLSNGPLIAMHIPFAAVVVALPCEMTQRALNAVGETRDLLLRSEWQRPELQQELSLFRDTVGRDLDTLGDLGLFRLERPTLLASSATILTYVIVLVQFYAAK